MCWYVLIQQKSNMKNVCFEFPDRHPWVPHNRFQAIRRELVGDGIALEEAGLVLTGLPLPETNMGVSKNRGKTPKWMIYMEIPIKMDYLGVPPFSETPI